MRLDLNKILSHNFKKVVLFERLQKYKLLDYLLLPFLCETRAILIE